MLFKDCKQGYPIYIIDRKAVTVVTAKVTNASMPHLDNHFPGSAKMVVDINVEADGIANTYVLDDTAEIGYVGNLAITANRECVTREIESVKSQAEEGLRMNTWYHEAIAKCDTILKDFSPEYKQRNEYSERLSGVEKKVDLLSNAVTELIAKLEKGGAR